jgi:hypothetical protein
MTSKLRLGCLASFLIVGLACGSAARSRKPGDSTGGQGGEEDPGGSGGTVAGTGGTSGTGGTIVPKDAGGEPDVIGSGPTDGEVPVDVNAATDSGPAPDTASGVAICWRDPKVIMICHQLENACINCGSGKNPPANTDAVACFELIKKAYAGMATDIDCVKFAAAHGCKPDDATTTGNVCGGLDCQAPGCKDPAKCEFVKQDGESDKCQPYVATCPCG